MAHQAHCRVRPKPDTDVFMRIQLKPEPELKEKGIDLTGEGPASPSTSVLENLKKGREEDTLADKMFQMHGETGLTSFYYTLGLLKMMYLVATGMRLAPCALGGGNFDLFCKVMGTNYLEERSVGEFVDSFLVLCVKKYCFS
jgi:hypothetical protein